MGAELCLAHDMGGWRHMGGPLSVDMQPYGCFIFFGALVCLAMPDIACCATYCIIWWRQWTCLDKGKTKFFLHLEISPDGFVSLRPIKETEFISVRLYHFLQTITGKIFCVFYDFLWFFVIFMGILGVTCRREYIVSLMGYQLMTFLSFSDKQTDRLNGLTGHSDT